jgi:catechol 2,3-dioxygenase-like lactoylglutathione lyase family enzyme
MARIGLVTLVVAEYDEAIAFYRDRVGFELVEDTDLGEGRRWVVVAPPGDAPRPATGVLLAKASGLHQLARIGDQTGGRVALFLMTDDLAADHARMTAAGVTFVEEPRKEAYGTVAVFEDLYGTRWDLIEPA